MPWSIFEIVSPSLANSSYNLRHLIPWPFAMPKTAFPSFLTIHFWFHGCSNKYSSFCRISLKKCCLFYQRCWSSIPEKLCMLVQLLYLPWSTSDCHCTRLCSSSNPHAASQVLKILLIFMIFWLTIHLKEMQGWLRYSSLYTLSSSLYSNWRSFTF